MKGQKDRVWTRKEVEEKADPDKQLLVIVHDRVYDCTRWQKHHPGGHLTLRSLCGKDATDAFMATHPAYVEKRLLSKFQCATLADVGEPDETTAAFRKLTAELKEGGWFETDYTFYYKKVAVFALMFLGVVAGVVLSENVLVHACAGVLLGMFWQQVAFIGHDLGHNSITHDRETDSILGLFAGNFFTGISIGWWKRAHNIHHIVPNSLENDPDIQNLPIFAISTEFLTSPTFSTFYEHVLLLDRLAHLLVSQQHWLYYPVMAFARFNLYAQSLTHAMGTGVYDPSEKLWNRNLQVLFLLGFWSWLSFLVYLLPTWTSRVVFFMLAHNVAGILHVQITLSHFSMPSYSGVTYDSPTTGYLQTQLETTMDIDCATWMDWFHGGLQFQVVHHLWPRVPRHKLRDLRTILIEFCKMHNLKYHEETFFKANGIMLSRLRQVAKTAKSFSEIFSEAINLSG